MQDYKKAAERAWIQLEICSKPFTSTSNCTKRVLWTGRRRRRSGKVLVLQMKAMSRWATVTERGKSCKAIIYWRIAALRTVGNEAQWCAINSLSGGKGAVSSEGGLNALPKRSSNWQNLHSDAWGTLPAKDAKTTRERERGEEIIYKMTILLSKHRNWRSRRKTNESYHYHGLIKFQTLIPYKTFDPYWNLPFMTELHLGSVHDRQSAIIIIEDEE